MKNTTMKGNPNRGLKNSSRVGVTNIVDRRSFLQALPHIHEAIDKCSFVAIDTEFTGLGVLPARRAKDVMTRYKALRDEVLQYSLLQLGFSFFIDSENNARAQPSGTSPAQLKTYKTVTYTLNLARQEDYVVSPDSMKFLVKSGVDLNSIFCDGIPFHFCLENDSKNCRRCEALQNPEIQNQSRRQRFYNTEINALFTHIRSSGKFVCVHNGILDLLYLHASFYK